MPAGAPRAACRLRGGPVVCFPAPAAFPFALSPRFPPGCVRNPYSVAPGQVSRSTAIAITDATIDATASQPPHRLLRYLASASVGER